MSFVLMSSTCTYAFSLHLSPSSTSVWILFSKEEMTEIYFVNYCQSKNHKHCHKILLYKKLFYKTIWKCRIKISTRALGLRLRFLTVRRWWEWKILPDWTSHFLQFLFCNEPAKKRIYGVRALTAESSFSSRTSQCALSWATLLPSGAYVLYGGIRSGCSDMFGMWKTWCSNL